MANHRSQAIAARRNQSALITPQHAYDRLQVILSGLRAHVGPAQIVPLFAALLFAIGCTLWAIQEGVSVPLALMGGYCTIVAGIMLCAVQLILTHLRASARAAPATRKPNYAAWKLVNKLNVSNASRLWCDIEPGHPYTQESAAWAAAILDAIKSGALPVSPKPHATDDMIARERTNPGWNTEIARDALKSWASAHGHCPAFLRD